MARGTERAGIGEGRPVPQRPSIVPCSAGWLVFVVGVDGVLSALQGSDEDPLQGLRLPCSSARGHPMPW